MGEQAKTGSACVTFVGRMARGTRRLRTALGEELLDDAVFERMEGDDDQASAWRERLFGRV